MDISEIARLAGVSPSTVSKVINHKDGSISASTRERILKIVREYHYSPHSRSRATRNWLIGVLLRSSISLDSTLDGILSNAQEKGYSTLVYISNMSLEQERKNVAALSGAGVAGIIWEPVGRESLALRSELEGDSTKLITIGPILGDRSLLLPYAAAARSIALELVRRGHRNIACLVGEGRRKQDFIRGFRECLFENGMSFEDSMVYTEITSDLLSNIGRERVTGVICSHYHLARALNARLKALHYHAPDDFSIVSLRNDAGSSWAEDTDEKISTCTMRNADFGRLACDCLIGMMEGRETDAADVGFSQELRLDNTSSLGAPPLGVSRRVVVVGSINIDMRLSVPSLPSGGSTISAESALASPGGKGSNQAVGVAKLGHHPILIGNVGSDTASDTIYRELGRCGVNTSGIYRKPGEETGRAIICVDPEGESMITVLSGANASVRAADVTSRESLFEGAEYCLVQTEIPLDAVAEACRAAHRHGAKTVLKPAACRHLPDEIVSETDYLVPNKRELEAICPDADTLEDRARMMLRRGAGAVIVTLGSEGCLLCTNERTEPFPAYDFDTIDSTGAGDAFISAFVSHLIYGCSLDEAIRRANFAAGLSTTRHGTIDSLVDLRTLERETLASRERDPEGEDAAAREAPQVRF